MKEKKKKPKAKRLVEEKNLKIGPFLFVVYKGQKIEKAKGIFLVYFLKKYKLEMLEI